MPAEAAARCISQAQSGIVQTAGLEAQRQSPSMKGHAVSRDSSSFGGCKAYGGDSICVCIGLPIGLLAKDIWIGFPLTEVARRALPKRPYGLQREVGGRYEWGGA